MSRLVHGPSSCAVFECQISVLENGLYLDKQPFGQCYIYGIFCVNIQSVSTSRYNPFRDTVRVEIQSISRYSPSRDTVRHEIQGEGSELASVCIMFFLVRAKMAFLGANLVVLMMAK